MHSEWPSVSDSRNGSDPRSPTTEIACRPDPRIRWRWRNGLRLAWLSLAGRHSLTNGYKLSDWRGAVHAASCSPPDGSLHPRSRRESVVNSEQTVLNMRSKLRNAGVFRVFALAHKTVRLPVEESVF